MSHVRDEPRPPSGRGEGIELSGHRDRARSREGPDERFDTCADFVSGLAGSLGVATPTPTAVVAGEAEEAAQARAVPPTLARPSACSPSRRPGLRWGSASRSRPTPTRRRVNGPLRRSRPCWSPPGTPQRSTWSRELRARRNSGDVRDGRADQRCLRLDLALQRWRRSPARRVQPRPKRRRADGLPAGSGRRRGIEFDPDDTLEATVPTRRRPEPALRDYRAHGQTGHELTDPLTLQTEEEMSPYQIDRTILGRVLCFRADGGRFWMEWTDNRSGVYTTASGRRAKHVIPWWESSAGPMD